MIGCWTGVLYFGLLVFALAAVASACIHARIHARDADDVVSTVNVIAVDVAVFDTLSPCVTVAVKERASP